MTSLSTRCCRKRDGDHSAALVEHRASAETAVEEDSGGSWKEVALPEERSKVQR